MEIADGYPATTDPQLAQLTTSEKKEHAELVCLRALELGKNLDPGKLAARYGYTTPRWANYRKRAALWVYERQEHLAAVGG
jgi:hypothetical protein